MKLPLTNNTNNTLRLQLYSDLNSDYSDLNLKLCLTNKSDYKDVF